jgi:hypothetical protein
MTANRNAPHRTPAHVLKSPLAAHSRGARGSRVPVLAGTAAQGKRAETSARAITLQDFADYLLTTNNRFLLTELDRPAHHQGKIVITTK